MNSIRWFGMAACSLLIAGCGFQAIHQDGQADLLSDICISSIESRDELKIRRLLVNQYGVRSDCRANDKRLVLVTNADQQDVSINTNDIVTRVQMRLIYNYKLHAPDGNILLDSQESVISSYDIASSPFATLSSRYKTTTLLLEEMTRRLSLSLQRLAL